MFTQKEEGFAGATVIAEGVIVEGNFKGDGPMIIDGTVKGTIATSKSVEIGKSATIEANIKADSVVIGGFVKGNIVAKSRLELLSGSHVEGDIATGTLIVAEGAILNGKCTTGTRTPQDALDTKSEAAKLKEVPQQQKINGKARV
ncbi:MAG: polymer-forming cytoskeletal protein [Patescibacteria group bacterium]|jgi:cytoskeletal protein CcmA (bactofilin family)